MIMTVVFNLFSVAILAIPAHATAFNWTLVAAAAAVVVLMIFFYENQSKRSKLDT